MNPLIAAMPIHAPAVPGEATSDLPARLRALAAAEPDRLAVIDAQGSMTRAELVGQADRIARALLADGLRRGDTVAILATNGCACVAVLMGILSAGGCAVPLPGSASTETLHLMLEDSDAGFLFADWDAAARLEEGGRSAAVKRRVLLREARPGWSGLDDWLADAPGGAPVIALSPDDAFAIIYSSGTTGRPKGIVHDHRSRLRQIERYERLGYRAGCVTLLAIPLYSNTAMISLLPTLAGGGLVVLMAAFDARTYLQLAERHAVTHTTLVPVQYKRILAEPDFDRTDLSTFELKTSVGAPLHAPLIDEIVRRWPGRMVETYGMTEGGGTATLDCAAFPDKWTSVGRISPESTLHVIDAEGRVLPQGSIGELVGRGPIMMRGYYKRPEASEEILWRDGTGAVFHRTGDMARIDDEGFVHLYDRKKDMILSGGFNIFAEDLERVLLAHEGVADAAVIGVPSEAWGETPLALVVAAPGHEDDPEALRAWANAQLGKTQRLSRVEFRAELPRNPLGKVLKRELRAPYWPDATP